MFDFVISVNTISVNKNEFEMMSLSFIQKDHTRSLIYNIKAVVPHL